MNRSSILACAALAAVFSSPATGYAKAPLPTISLTGLTVKRTPVSDRLAGTVDLRVRLCVSIGPRAQIIWKESRRTGSTVKAQGTTVDPLGVDLTKISPYACVSNYQISWAVQARFMVGRGTYAVSVRVRDGYGRLSEPASFTVSL